MEYLECSDEEVMNFHRIISDNVKRIRKEKKVTQLDLALTIGHKSMSTIDKIAKALGVDMCEFFT